MLAPIASASRIPMPVQPSALPVPSAPAPAEQTPTTDALKDTPYQRIKNSAPGRFVRENKILTGVAATGGTIVIAGASAASPAFARLAEYGIVPAVGAGVAVLGATAVHDAIVNDLDQHPVKATAKIGLGTTAALGGTQVVGATYDIPVLDRALTGTIEKVLDHGQAVLGAGVLAGAAAAGKLAVDRAQAALEKREHRGANAALAVTAGGASAAGVLGGIELIGRQYDIPVANRVFTRTVEALAQGGAASVAGGALLVAGAGVLVDEAVQNVRKGGNDVLTVAEGMGAVTAGLGGLELVGHGLDFEPLRGLLTNHADTVGSVALAGLGGALTRVSVDDARTNGIGLRNTAGATIGGTMIAGGVGTAAYTYGFEKAAEVAGRSAGVIGGVGLGVATGVLARNAIRQFRDGDVLSGTVSSVGAATTATGSLFATGEALGIEAISQAGHQIADATVVPFWDHVVEPAARFLYNNPVAGGVVLVAGVGAYAWYRSRHHAA